MTTTIIFSFDRAMQLDLLLESITKYDVSGQLDLQIIYATSDISFDEGYEKLKFKYTNIGWHKEAQFKERFVYPNLPLYWHNYFWWLKYKYNRYIKSDFKYKVISVLRNSVFDTVMFLTDDSLFFNEIKIDIEVVDKIILDGKNNSFSLRHGANVSGGTYVEKGNTISWQTTDKHEHREWSYPFSVDGHIYNTSVVEKILKKVIFKNPNTLEGNVACYVNENKLFKKLFAHKQSSLLGFELNMVQTVTNNNNLNISNQTLNELYLEGFKITLNYKIANYHFFRPELENVMATKNDNTILLYEQ
jgi:hypothetical protein